MEFVSIATILDELADQRGYKPNEGETERYSVESMEKAKVYSAVASDLHQALHNADEGEVPQWVEVSRTTGRPLYCPAVKGEGMGILEYAAGWLARLEAEHLRYLQDLESAESAGIDAAKIQPCINPNGGLHTLKVLVSRSHEIGFERGEIQTLVNSKPKNIASSWAIKQHRRQQGYAAALERALKHFYTSGHPQPPSAREVLEYWRETRETHCELGEVLAEEIKYYDAKGDIKGANLDAIHKAIKRRTTE